MRREIFAEPCWACIIWCGIAYTMALSGMPVCVAVLPWLHCMHYRLSVRSLFAFAVTRLLLGFLPGNKVVRACELACNGHVIAGKRVWAGKTPCCRVTMLASHCIATWQGSPSTLRPRSTAVLWFTPHAACACSNIKK